MIDGFCKSHGMTGWRLGFVHGPAEVIDTMIKLQQYTFVCAPQPAQWAGAVAMDVDMRGARASDYRRKRDLIVSRAVATLRTGHAGRGLLRLPQGPAGAPARSSSTEAIEQQPADHPGNIFSRRDTHFRISYAAADRDHRARHRGAARTRGGLTCHLEEPLYVWHGLERDPLATPLY